MSALPRKKRRIDHPADVGLCNEALFEVLTFCEDNRTCLHLALACRAFHRVWDSMMTRSSTMRYRQTLLRLAFNTEERLAAENPDPAWVDRELAIAMRQEEPAPIATRVPYDRLPAGQCVGSDAELLANLGKHPAVAAVFARLAAINGTEDNAVIAGGAVTRALFRRNDFSATACDALHDFVMAHPGTRLVDDREEYVARRAFNLGCVRLLDSEESARLYLARYLHCVHQKDPFDVDIWFLGPDRRRHRRAVATALMKEHGYVVVVDRQKDTDIPTKAGFDELRAWKLGLPMPVSPDGYAPIITHAVDLILMDSPIGSCPALLAAFDIAPCAFGVTPRTGTTADVRCLPAGPQAVVSRVSRLARTSDWTRWWQMRTAWRAMKYAARLGTRFALGAPHDMARYHRARPRSAPPLGLLRDWVLRIMPRVGEGEEMRGFDAWIAGPYEPSEHARLNPHTEHDAWVSEGTDRLTSGWGGEATEEHELLDIVARFGFVRAPDGDVLYEKPTNTGRIWKHGVFVRPNSLKLVVDRDGPHGES